MLQFLFPLLYFQHTSIYSRSLWSSNIYIYTHIYIFFWRSQWYGIYACVLKTK